MYAMTCVKPNITYAVGILSKYTSNPSRLYWSGVIRILKYLKATKNYGICYTSYPSILEGFSNTNWITNRDDHPSTSG